MRSSDLKKFIYLGSGVTAFRVALDFSYAKVISQAYSSVGFVKHLDSNALLLSYLALLVVIFLLLPIRNSLSNKCAQLLCLFGIVPLTSYYAWTGMGAGAIIYGLVFWAIVIATTWVITIRRGYTLFKNDSLAIILAVSCALAAIILSLMVFGFQLNFSIYSIYSFRAERSFSNIPLGGYIIPWAAKVAVPFLVLYFAYRRSAKFYSLLISAVCAQILLYAITGHKTFLFLVPAVFVVSKLSVSRSFIGNLAWLSAVGVFLFAYIDVATSGSALSGLLTRRVFFVPAQLTHMYFDYFDGEYLYLSHSILSPFLDYPYTLNPPKLIGLSYFGSADQAANTGIVADAFMNFGAFGVILWAALLSAVLVIVEKVSYGRRKALVYPLIILAFYNMLNGAFLTSLLTHGVIFAALLVATLRPEESGK